MVLVPRFEAPENKPNLGKNPESDPFVYTDQLPTDTEANSLGLGEDEILMQKEEFEAAQKAGRIDPQTGDMISELEEEIEKVA